MILCQAHANDANHAGSFRFTLTHFRLSRNVIELVPLAVGAFQDPLGTEHLSAFFFILNGFQCLLNLLSAVFVGSGNTEFIEYLVRVVTVVVMMVVMTASALMVVVLMVMVVMMFVIVFLMVVVVMMFVMAAASVLLMMVFMFIVIMMVMFRLMLCLLPMRFFSQVIQLRR